MLVCLSSTNLNLGQNTVPYSPGSCIPMQQTLTFLPKPMQLFSACWSWWNSHKGFTDLVSDWHNRNMCSPLILSDISGCQILLWIELLFPEKELYVQEEHKSLLCCENHLYAVSRYGVKTTLTWRGTSENVALPGRKWTEILPCKAAEKSNVFIIDMQTKLLLFVLYELKNG